ncbi:rab11 family-interacting protein 4 isoform X2 [Photinus pyralis]|uniref:FIP-RBD domain-containing protein n=1 Tax=Photinus pyralis TaxID=7054 RepID=A0A1Y1MUY1_PHOPY|nr:rab11 family-interacting protein 4 isoform X2 [Photinus pyralis]
MMSPITAATEDPATGNGSAGPEPRFVLSPPESPQLTDANKSQCSSLSDAENYECYGEGADIDLDSGISTDRSPGDGLQTSPITNGIKRHTWLRTSLRRSPSNNNQENLPNRRWGSFRHSGKRQLGSNALASQLYRSSSFNSSGRSSTCDTADDMYSDASLEEDVLDLNNKFQLLQQQVGYLQDSANHNDERYTRAKADNAALQARVIMLEEQLRDSEMRYEDRLQDEQRRSKELMLRVEREKQLQLENANIRLQSAEAEANSLKQEISRQRIRIEKLESEGKDFYDQIQDLKHELQMCKEREAAFKEQEKRLIQEEEAHTNLIKDLSHEVERLRSEARTPALPTTSPETLRLEELHQEMAVLRDKNIQLQEANEELQANLLTAGVEQGRLLTAGETSLAAELEAMTHDQIQQALKEQQDVNNQLRSYIDGILLNIVENYPQLLEVKRKPV